jgi:hypothetical protein
MTVSKYTWYIKITVVKKYLTAFKLNAGKA